MHSEFRTLYAIRYAQASPALPSPGRKEEAAVATPEQLRLEDARVLAKENPMAVANILKTWLNGEPA